LSSDFAAPDLSGPLQLDERLALAPADFTVKGMFLASVALEGAAAARKTLGRRYVPYKDYPLSEWLTLLDECAPLAYPNQPPKEALRRLGHGAYGTFADSMVGKVIVNLGIIDFESALKLAPRMYALSGTSGSVAVVMVGPGSAIVSLTDCYDYPDAWHVGVFEGGMAAFRVHGTVRIRNVTLSSAELLLEWG
jgi:uncharacterized protein (TIGR02265 family)